MQPQEMEIEEVGKAFIDLTTRDYTPEQQKYLTDFLKRHANDLNREAAKKIFSDKIQVIDAMIVLNDFANHYHDEKSVIDEFRDEIEYLVITINDTSEDGIII